MSDNPALSRHVDVREGNLLAIFGIKRKFVIRIKGNRNGLKDYVSSIRVFYEENGIVVVLLYNTFKIDFWNYYDSYFIY